MDIVVALFWILSAVVTLLTAFLFFEIVCASLFVPRSKQTSAHVGHIAVSSKAAILIPAHNEEDVIGDTLQSILPQLRDGDEVVVVADNCSDNTRQVAQSFGVTVLERHDLERRGKGYALDFAVAYIKDKNFDAVLMIDADCIVEEHCRDRLVAECLETARPVQCLYLMHASETAPSIGQKISEFAWLIKNKLRPLGLLKVKGPCHLMGTGMAFPTKMISDTNLATGCIVEDMKLGLDLAVAGTPPKFLPDALVWSRFPESDETSEGQKSRWIHGHLEMISLYAFSLLKQALLKRDINLLLLFFELLLPPLVLLLIINVVVLFTALLLSLISGSSLWLLSSLSVLIMGLSLVLAWLLEGRQIISLRELIEGLMARLKASSVYLRFLTDRRKDWNKTSRKE